MEHLSKERTTVEAASEKLISTALKAGAERAEVAASYHVKTKMTLEKQDFHLASSDDGYSLGVRVLIGDKQGFASCNTVDANDLKETAQKAAEIAKLSAANPFCAIEPSPNIPMEAPKETWDNALFDLSLPTQREWTKVLAAAGLKDKRFRINEGSVTVGGSLFLISNSQGTQKLSRETDLTWGLMGMGVDGDNITSFDYFQQLARRLQGLPEVIRSTTERFCESVVANLATGLATSYRGPVLFSPRGVIDILLSPISYHVNGRQVAEKTSRWGLEQLGSQVLSPLLSVTDNAWLTDRFGFARFDREGFPTRPVALIEKGHLKSFLTDTYSGRALKLASTGNAAGPTSGIPGVSAHCLVIKGGDKSYRELARDLSAKTAGHLVVHRFSGQVDPVTGDFSGVAKGGEWWQNNERSYFVKETLISGNIFDALGKDLLGISRETEVIDCSEEAPWLVTDGISVTANG